MQQEEVRKICPVVPKLYEQEYRSYHNFLAHFEKKQSILSQGRMQEQQKGRESVKIRNSAD
jgi:hypothetical protein